MKVFPIKFEVSTWKYTKLFHSHFLLNIVTLGLYSAWLNIRTRQFFYSQAHINDSSFRYDAEPIKIMNFRLIIFTIIAFLVASEFYSTLLTAILLTGFLFIFPELANYHINYRLTHTSFRNIRFSFKANYREAFIVFGLILLTVPLSLGLTYPYFVYRKNQYIYNSISYGKTEFTFNSKLIHYYEILGNVILNLIFAVALIMFTSKSLTVLAHTQGLEILISILIASAFLIYNWAYLITHKFNYDLEGIEIGEIRFQSDLVFSKVLSIMTINFLIVVFSLGFLVPVAKLRLLTYKMSMISFCIDNEWQTLKAADRTTTRSLTERVQALTGIKLGLGT